MREASALTCRLGPAVGLRVGAVRATDGVRRASGERYGRRVDAIRGVHLQGGPYDGERPEPLPGTAFPHDLDAITVMDHATGVGYVYEVTSSRLIEGGVRRHVLGYRRAVPRDLP